MHSDLALCGNVTAVRFVTCRIVSTETAAVFFRNPYASSSTHTHFVTPVFEGNRGAALQFEGGQVITIDDAHFEQNGTRDGQPDLLVGALDVPGSRAICEAQLRGGVFSTAHANQNISPDPSDPAWKRVQFTHDHVHLSMLGTLINSRNRIDAATHIIGSRIAFISMQTIPGVLNFTPATPYIWPPLL
jgi:hypothetical protein